MSVKMTGKYIGNKKIELRHNDSGAVIYTAAPLDNNGDGSSFSPTDLFTSSLGACMLTIMGILAERDAIDLSSSYYLIEKIMSDSPRRVGKIILDIHLPSNFTDEQKKKYERAANTCPVHHSLHPEIDVKISFIYDV